MHCFFGQLAMDKMRGDVYNAEEVLSTVKSRVLTHVVSLVICGKCNVCMIVTCLISSKIPILITRWASVYLSLVYMINAYIFLTELLASPKIFFKSQSHAQFKT